MVKTMPEISVIIPVRNEEKRIAEAVENVLSQDFTDLELLLIENGSKDNTKGKAKELSGRYENVRFISLGKDVSIGLARQAGLSEAKGNYLCFLDADDHFTEKNTLSLLYKRLSGAGGDIAVGNYVRLFGEELVPAARHGYGENTDTDTEQFRFEAFFSGGILSYLWGKLYRADFIKENGITFSDLFYGEDKQFNLLCYAKKPRYVFQQEDVYCYTMNPASISHRYHPNYGENWRNAALGLLRRMNRAERNRCFSLSAYTLLFSAFFDGKQEAEHSRSLGKLRHVMKWYCADPFFRKLLKKMKKERTLDRLENGFWKTAMKLLLFLVLHNMELPMAVGALGIITLKIDKKLSSTGR